MYVFVVVNWISQTFNKLEVVEATTPICDGLDLWMNLNFGVWGFWEVTLHFGSLDVWYLGFRWAGWPRAGYPTCRSSWANPHVTSHVYFARTHGLSNGVTGSRMAADVNLLRPGGKNDLDGCGWINRS